jgi:hypothetical protein
MHTQKCEQELNDPTENENEPGPSSNMDDPSHAPVVGSAAKDEDEDVSIQVVYRCMS